MLVVEVAITLWLEGHLGYKGIQTLKCGQEATSPHVLTKENWEVLTNVNLRMVLVVAL